MASLFVGFLHGQTLLQPEAFLTGSTTTGTGRDIELRIDTGKGWNRGDILLALRGFETWVMSASDTTFQKPSPS